MSFVLGATSLKRLNGVDERLVKVVKRAIELTTVDFTVFEGLRTKARQQELVRTGASKTMNSKHIIGQAVDLVPYVGGKARWEWPLIYPIAEAVRKASIELNVPLRWGGVWDKVLDDLSTDLKKEVADYCVRHSGPDFLDGPHYELRL